MQNLELITKLIIALTGLVGAVGGVVALFVHAG